MRGQIFGELANHSARAVRSDVCFVRALSGILAGKGFISRIKYDDAYQKGGRNKQIHAGGDSRLPFSPLFIAPVYVRARRREFIYAREDPFDTSSQIRARALLTNCSVLRLDPFSFDVESPEGP